MKSCFHFIFSSLPQWKVLTGSYIYSKLVFRGGSGEEGGGGVQDASCERELCNSHVSSTWSFKFLVSNFYFRDVLRVFQFFSLKKMYLANFLSNLKHKFNLLQRVVMQFSSLVQLIIVTNRVRKADSLKDMGVKRETVCKQKG